MSLECYLINRTDYCYVRKLGQGSFGIVYLGHPRNDEKQKIAIKSLSCDEYDFQTQKFFIREISIMSGINHPSILKLVGFSLPSKEDNCFLIYSKYMPNQTLKSVILKDECTRQNRKLMNPTRLSKIVYGIASSMKYLHSKNIVHRDLKPDNIFIDENFLPILSDFGLSRFLNNEMKMTKKLGTPYYMAPEMFNDDELPTNKIDVYAFAVTLLYLFTAVLEFEGNKPRTINQFAHNIMSGNRFIIPENVPSFYKSLINRCWSNSPAKRPSFAKIVNELENNDDFLFPGANSKEVHDYINELNGYETTEENDNVEEYENEYDSLEETEEFDFFQI